MFIKDRKAINDILNLLKKDSYIKDVLLSQLLTTASPAFII